MRLARLSVENYRSFLAATRLEIRPLTLFFGYNSAGKSALLRLLSIIAASAGDQLAPLALDSPAARGASFKDVLSRHGSSPLMRIGLEWESTPGLLSVGVGVRDIPERQLQVIEKVNIRTDAGNVDAVWNASTASVTARAREYDVSLDGGTVGTHTFAFRGLAPIPQPGMLSSTALTIVEQAESALLSLRDRVHWLNSLRAVPPRLARFGALPLKLTADGSNAGDFLAHDALGEGALVREVSAGFAKITNHQLAVKQYPVAGETQYSVVLAEEASSAIEVPIVDTGEGMAQLLPVLVLGCLAKLGRLDPQSLLAVEHPDSQLHPAAHAPLAEFFCELAAHLNGPECVIETHSENFLLRVQIAIASGDIPAERVIIHWVKAVQGGSAVDTITFDKAARPQGAGWPPGVFSEDIEQARELLKIRKQKGMA